MHILLDTAQIPPAKIPVPDKKAAARRMGGRQQQKTNYRIIQKKVLKAIR